MPITNNSRQKTQCSFSICNFIIIGILFMLGSYFRFPTVHLKYPNSQTISIWCYIIGSACFIFVSLQQFLDSSEQQDNQRTKNKCKNKNVNGLMFAASSGLFIGFALFLPAFKSERIGYICLMASSTMFIITQLYKFLYFVFNGNGILNSFNIFRSKFYFMISQACLLATGILFLIAFIEDRTNIQHVKLHATSLLCAGGFLMYLSKIISLGGVFLNDKYCSSGSIAVSQTQQKSQQLESQQLN